MKNEKIEYLKNELKNYNFIKKWLENDSYIFADRIAFYEEKIHEIDIELNYGNVKSIDHDCIPTSAVHEPLLTLLADQEEYIKRRDELVDLKDRDIYGFKARVKYIEECLNKLDEEWQRTFIIEYYCNNKGINELVDKVNKSQAQLYRDKELLINKMLKDDKNYHD